MSAPLGCVRVPTLIVLLGLTLIGCERLANPSAPSQASIIEADAKPGSGSGPFSLDMRASKWLTLSQPNNAWPLRVTFDGPPQPYDMAYLYTPSPQKVIAGTVRASFTITGDGQWIAREPDGNPANVRLFLHSYRDDWNTLHPEARWWSNPLSADLIASSGALVSALDPALWSDADGHRGTDIPAAFADALKNVSSLGVTFGTRTAFGHGVYTVGAATFALTAYGVS